ncbi:hypothetical protein R1sor_027254 [Riccia sorocarpa]|uniref:Uncharacterized protein n=1 Tax=Riccia sorocarpa TaxID=122646 RepID=A0ABD3GHD0_9MARC
MSDHFNCGGNHIPYISSLHAGRVFQFDNRVKGLRRNRIDSLHFDFCSGKPSPGLGREFKVLIASLSIVIDATPVDEDRRGFSVGHHRCLGIIAGMASAAGNKGLSGRKRTTPEDLLEHATHMELENQFLEARVKTLEEEGRKNRLKVDDLRRELRECKDALEKERISVANFQKDNKELIASHAEVMLKWRKAIDEKRALRASLQTNQ